MNQSNQECANTVPIETAMANTEKTLIAVFPRLDQEARQEMLIDNLIAVHKRNVILHTDGVNAHLPPVLTSIVLEYSLPKNDWREIFLKNKYDAESHLLMVCSQTSLRFVHEYAVAAFGFGLILRHGLSEMDLDRDVGDYNLQKSTTVACERWVPYILERPPPPVRLSLW